MSRDLAVNGRAFAGLASADTEFFAAASNFLIGAPPWRSDNLEPITRTWRMRRAMQARAESQVELSAMAPPGDEALDHRTAKEWRFQILTWFSTYSK
jgi:hypothetical protein